MTDSNTPDEGTQQQQQQNRGASTAKVVGVAVAALLVGVVALAIKGGTDAADAEGDKYGAQDVCEQFVEKRLKAPATAEFSGENTTDLGAGLWRVIGDVDSQNSFGAQIRSRYTCEVQFTGGENWSLRDISVN